MTPQPPPNGTDKSLGEIVSEVSEKASLLVREEIELAKAEVTAKAKALGRGAGVAIAAGVFLVFALVTFLHGLAWFFADLLDQPPWVGFGIVTLFLVFFAIVSALLAKKLLSSGAPPTPDMAIEEAKLTRATLEHQIEGDPPARSLEQAKTEASEETTNR